MPGRLFPKSFEGQAPQEFGIGANILKTRTFDLANARDLEQIEIGGSCIWAMAATSLTASIDVRVNDQLRDPLTFQQGMFVRGIPFSRVYVSHAAQVGATITLFFAVEEDVRNIEIINPSTQFNNVNIGNITQDDSWYYDSLQKKAFIGSKLVGNQATLNGHVQLWNPVSSGILALCKLISFEKPSATGSMELWIHNTELVSSSIFGVNKYLDEADGVCKVTHTLNAGPLGSKRILYSNYNIAGKAVIEFPNPFIIGEGKGLVAVNMNVDEWFTAFFEWVEIDA